MAKGLLLAAALATAGPIETECANEIGLFCASAGDVSACLKRNKAGLTVPCREALSGRVPTVAVPAPLAASAPPSRSPVRLSEDYDGPPGPVFRALYAIISAELPKAQRQVAETLGLPEYSEGFIHPLTVRIVHDPTGPEGAVVVKDAGLELRLNAAALENCHARPYVRSILLHEMSHAVLRDLVFEHDEPPPQWFDEGLATFVGGEPALGLTFDTALRRFGRGGFPSACELRSTTEGAVSEGIVMECYAYYAVAAGRLSQALPRILKGLAGPQGLEAAIQRETGLDSAAFRARVKADADRELNDLPWWRRFRGNWWQTLVVCRD